jgi:hypothetical protein
VKTLADYIDHELQHGFSALPVHEDELLEPKSNNDVTFPIRWAALLVAISFCK